MSDFASIIITLGNGAELGIDKYDNLFIRTQTDRDRWDHVSLGKATRERFEQIQTYLNRLKIYAVDA